jgi:hypothetical protein
VKNRPVTKMLVSMTLALGALASPALAGETTVNLAVRNWGGGCARESDDERGLSVRAES